MPKSQNIHHVYMPGYKHYYRAFKKGARKFSRAASRYSGTASKAAKALALASKVAAMINVEYKYHDVTDSGETVTDNAGVVVNCTEIAQGLTGSTRSGNSIKISSIQLTGDMVKGVDDAVCRVLLVHDRLNHADNASMTLAELFTGPGATANPLGFLRNRDFPGRFDILYDRSMVVEGSEEKHHPVHFFKKFTKPLHIHYDGANATDDRTGIYLLFVCNLAANRPYFVYGVRTTFVDN